MSSQNTLFDTAISRAVAILKNMGCQYQIVTPEGVVIGGIEKRRRAKSKYKHGEVLHYLLPYIVDLEAGSVAQIPFGPYDSKNVASSLSGYCTRVWGKESYTYETNAAGNGVTILRIL